MIRAEPLNRDAYLPYGTLVAADPTIPSKSANFGTAERYNHLGPLKNLRSGAEPNLCVFRSQPFSGNPFVIQLLERHPHSTQLFVPMSRDARYLVIVGNGEETPDLSTIKAFIAVSGQGITYHPGVWHHPLIALDRPTDFACVVYEDDSPADCDTRKIVPPIDVVF